MDEQSMVLRCQQGETQLLDNIVLLHEESLYRFCYHLSGDADSAAELFQDTWLKALKNIQKYKASGSFLGWLFTIAANHQRDNYRRHYRWKNILAKNQPYFPQPDPVDKGLLIHEQQMLVRQALKNMDDSLRIPVILFYFEEYRLETIAETLGLPLGTVKSRLYRAKKHLRNQLEVLL